VELGRTSDHIREMPLPSPSSSPSDLIPDNAFGNIDQLTASTEDSAGGQVRARARGERIPDEADYYRRSPPRRGNKNQWEGSRFFSGRKRSSGSNPSNPSSDRRLRRSTDTSLMDLAAWRLTDDQ
jgi:hypothetical protein